MADASPLELITSAKLARWVDPEMYSFTIRYNPELFPGLVHRYGLFILTKEDVCKLPQDIHTKGHFTTDHTCSHESLQTAATWLRACVQSHTQCNALEYSESWYPTRLLYLDESDGNKDYVRLIRTAEQRPDGPYATLSHRWGNARPLQLTYSMASDPNHQFSMASMPKTFREAIQASRRLGIQYLWIDSLCIIQEGDDRRDWYHEAGLMNKVYMHSYINISAADAEDSTKGLFRSRLPLLVGRHRVTVKTNTLGPDAELVDCLMTDFLLWRRTMETSPLNNRGWIFQERYLAPRVLYFCRNQLFWECKVHTVCETFPTGLPSIGWNFGNVSVKTWERQHGIMPPGVRDDSWIRFWDQSIVFLYSRMDLTVPTDRLIALSGIAKYFMARVQDTYVAGMWRRRLEESLLWFVDPGSPEPRTRPRPTPYRSPSWSWASVDGTIMPIWHSKGREGIIHVEDVVLSYATDDTLGAVSGGWLDLRGSLKPMRLYEDEEWDAAWCMAVGNPVISEGHGVIQESAFMTFSVWLDVLPGGASALNSHNAQGHYFFMPCDIKGEVAEEVCCLLFELVDKEKVLFERIGSVSTAQPDEIEQLLADLDEETKARVPCLQYQDGLHTIRVI